MARKSEFKTGDSYVLDEATQRRQRAVERILRANILAEGKVVGIAVAMFGEADVGAELG